jgi:hypothetical protein
MNSLLAFKTFALIASVSFVSSMAMAATPAPKVQFGQAKFTGAGCPAGKATFTPNPDGTTFSVLFDGYEVSTDQAVGYKYCTMTVPVKAAKRTKFRIETMDYRGFFDLKPWTAAQVGSFAQFHNTKSQTTPGQWNTFIQYGAMTDNFVETIPMSASSDSFCGDAQQWMIVHNVLAVYNFKPQAGKTSMATLDSIDTQGLIKGKLKFSACK